MNSATLFLRLEGPLQSWGYRSHWTIRDTATEPTKSGVVGLICCAMGRRRGAPINDLTALTMGVRVDRPGETCVDYHTVGAKIGCMSARGKIKYTEKTGEIETVISRRFYLCDASFLVALMGNKETLEAARNALLRPVWPVYLGRKSCPPAVPPVTSEERVREHDSLLAALRAPPWRPRLAFLDPEPDPPKLRCVLEADSGDGDAELRNDVPVCFGSREHHPRYVRQAMIELPQVGDPTQTATPRPRTPHVKYEGDPWQATSRAFRTAHPLCQFCKAPAGLVHHVSYRRAGHERPEDLRSLCDLCHDAVTALEYEYDLGTERIDPASPAWREAILAKRDEILSEHVLLHRAGRR